MENNIIFQKEYSFSDCKSKNNRVLRFDFAIFDKDNKLIKLIEFDGEQHFKPIKYFGGEDYFEYIKENDTIKNNYCINNNIELLRIPYTQLKKLKFEDLKICLIESNL